MTQQTNKDPSQSETTTPPTTPVTVKKPALCGNCDTEKTTLSTLEEEAMAAVREHAFAVNLIGVSEMLPRTPQLLFINVTTSENHTHCIELTIKGWRVASNRNDCMNGDFRQLDIHTKYFSTLHALLTEISPLYREKFGAQLIAKLSDLKKERSDSTE
ncbi:hypothetical protein GCK72_006206 [Caenorhabditis remanei]|uniref:GSKIP domain-containing protein n=2 Tax=Caenorhabditis remanei TaxID=31234 RepID=E3LR99_CAERE|nr:hypothetical protein GCK72_006206 [Caenorhabditis remanei]EFP07579.1 hypothetical protein CRE_26560 [Caenorhabditis remanei]KAF1766250.1 hypothetical protein GCK72_006206 [Caenorhabditis remanei]